MSRILELPIGTKGGLREALTRALQDAQPTDTVAWWREDLAPLLSDRARWPQHLRHPLEIRHLGHHLTPLSVRCKLAVLGYEDPAMLPGGSLPRQSWLISAGAGVASVAALRRLPIDQEYRHAAAAFAEAGVRGEREGVFAFEDPRLLQSSIPHESGDPWSSSDLMRLARRNWSRQQVTVLRCMRALGLLSGRSGRAQAAPQERTIGDTAPSREIDVVIPTLGRDELLADVLRDLAGQTAPPHRVVVVRQDMRPSAADTVETEQRAYPFELVTVRTNRAGASRARNLGIRQTTSPLVALLDDDVRLPPGLFQALSAEMSDLGLDGINAREVQPDHEVGTQRCEATRPSVVLSGNRSIVVREAILAAGGFDERLEGWGEDFELGFRLRLAGRAIGESGEHEIVHLKAPSGGFRDATARRTLEPWSHRKLTRPSPSPWLTYRRLRHLTRAMRWSANFNHLLAVIRGQPLFPLSILAVPLWLLRLWASHREALRLLRAGPILLTDESTTSI